MKIGSKQFTALDIITILARNLYYQNLIVEENQSSPVLDKHLDNLYTSVEINNINLKRKFVFDTYLQAYSDKKPASEEPRLRDWTSLSGMMIP